MNRSIEIAGKILRVPDRWRGSIRFGWPKDHPDGTTSFASNATKAAGVILDARSPEELAVAIAICDTMADAEGTLAVDAIKRRIEGGKVS